MIRARLGALLIVCSIAALVVVAGVRPDAAEAATERGRQVWVFLVPGLSFEQLLTMPEAAALASHGGAALLSLAGGLPTSGEGGPAPAEANVHERWVANPAALAGELRSALGGTSSPTLVIVASTVSSPTMIVAKDELHPLVLGEGRGASLLHRGREIRTLSSDSTRRDGVVVDVDVSPTIASFLGVPPPTDALGQPIRVVDAAPPFELHGRYLEQRRLSVPTGTAAALYVVIAGLIAAACVALRERVEPRLRRAMGWAALAVPALAVSLLAVGHLADLAYASVIPFVLLVTVLGTLAFSPLERRDLTLVPAGIGLAVLAFLTLEAVVGWTAMLTPLLGGSELDGGRFYGMPNVAIGLLLGACVWVAQRWSTPRGFILLCLAGLFAGLPLVGTNLGGAVTLFATAGLWAAVRARDRLGLARGVAVVIATTIVGTAVILLAHAVSPVTTHVTEFERSVNGASGVLGTIVDRLGVGVRLMARSPGSIIPVAGIPVCLFVVWRAPGAIGEAFRRWPAWRDATLVVLLGGVVAYLANDSGPAAAGLAFGLGLGGMLGVTLLGLPREAPAEEPRERSGEMPREMMDGW